MPGEAEPPHEFNRRFCAAGLIGSAADEGETSVWDIGYMTAGELIALEVKATGGPFFPSIEIIVNERNAAKRMREGYRLALVTRVKTKTPQVEILAIPVSMVRQKLVDIEPMMWRMMMRRYSYLFFALYFSRDNFCSVKLDRRCGGGSSASLLGRAWGQTLTTNSSSSLSFE